MPRRATLLLVPSLLALLSAERGMAQHSSLPLNPEKLHYAQEVEQEARRDQDSLRLAEAYYLYGKTSFSAGDITASKTHFLKSLRILEPRGDSYELGRIYLRLCENSRLSHSKEEIAYAYRAQALFERTKSRKGQMIANMTLGQIYSRDQAEDNGNLKSDSALIFYRRAERLSYQLKDSEGIADASFYLGDLYLARNHPKAVPYLEKALKLYQAKEIIKPRINVMFLLGRAYINSGQLSKGLSIISEAGQLYEKLQLNDLLLSVAQDEAMISYYQKTNQWQRAYLRYRDLYTKQNMQFTAERDGVLARLQVEYETEKKEDLSSQAKIVCIIFSLNMEFNYLVFRILKKSNI